MEVFLLSLLVMGLVMAGMAVGVMAGREPIKGSCGGIGALGLGQVCEICGNDPQRCETKSPLAPPKASFYDASDR